MLLKRQSGMESEDEIEVSEDEITKKWTDERREASRLNEPISSRRPVFTSQMRLMIRFH